MLERHLSSPEGDRCTKSPLALSSGVAQKRRVLLQRRSPQRERGQGHGVGDGESIDATATGNGVAHALPSPPPPSQGDGGG